MNRKKLVPLAVAVLLATGAAGSAAFAKGSGEDSQDIAAMANAKVTLSQAITTAEQQVGGRAINAGLDNENGAVRIAVEVAGSHGAQTVLVDPQTGKVIGTAPAENGDEGN